jgi:hypothetical protein
MNTLFKVVVLVCSVVSADIINANYQNSQNQAANVNQANLQQKDRKLAFSPYGFNQDFSAASTGQPMQNPSNNGMPGPFQDAPMPMFGLGGMTPPSLGLTNMPMNYMYGSPMMNPMSQAQGMMGAPNMANPMMNQGMLPQDPFNDASMMGNFGDDELNDPSFDGSRQLRMWGELPRAQVRVGSYCQNVRKQAVELANAIMKRQNRIVFKELMNYLLKSKYLIGMTEVKLTRVVRKKIYALMNQYSNIDESNVQFIPVKEDVVVQKQIVYQKADDNTTNASNPDSRRLNSKRTHK